jgi:hypothetical protein
MYGTGSETVLLVFLLDSCHGIRGNDVVRERYARTVYTASVVLKSLEGYVNTQ